MESLIVAKLFQRFVENARLHIMIIDLAFQLIIKNF